jgi:hypothetical protein
LNHTVPLGTAVVVPFALVAGYIALRLRDNRQTRETPGRNREHPAEALSRNKRVLLVVPFALLLAALTVDFAVTDDWPMVGLGVVGVGGFAFIIYRIATRREDFQRE